MGEERGRRWQVEEARSNVRDTFCTDNERERERERMRGGGDGTERARKKAIRYHGCANEIKEMNPGEREDRRRLRV